MGEKAVISKLAEKYKQLYIAPGENTLEQYKNVVLRGKDPTEKLLDHFLGSEEDELWTENTPAGDVEILYLNNREDFENFLRIMANKCSMAEIPPTTGAMTLVGIINWDKITQHKRDYLASGGTNWAAEQKRFTSVKENYTDTMIVISRGQYSGIDEKRAGFSAEEWLDISKKIRIYHECSHVICRRLYPEKKDAVWDEVAADAIGLLGALGTYDTALASAFLGVDFNGYTGGRLENYVAPEKQGEIDKIAVSCRRLMENIQNAYSKKAGMSPYEFLIFLEENKEDFFLDI